MNLPCCPAVADPPDANLAPKDFGATKRFIAEAIADTLRRSQTTTEFTKDFPVSVRPSAPLSPVVDCQLLLSIIADKLREDRNHHVNRSWQKAKFYLFRL